MDMTNAEAPDQGARSDGPSRRRLLTAGLSGAALAALVAGRASAATEEAPTTTAPPKRPTETDEQLLAFAQAAELAALELYDTAVSGDAGFDEASRIAMASIRQHHDAYAEALGGLLGRASVTEAAEAVLDAFSADFASSDPTTVATAAHELERTLVATHTSLLGELDGIDGSGLIASILVVEARHVPVLAQIAGLDPGSDLDAFVGQNDATPLSPETSA